MKRLFSLGLHRPDQAPTDADAELGALLEEQIADLVARGRSPEEARREAFAADRWEPARRAPPAPSLGHPPGTAAPFFRVARRAAFGTCGMPSGACAGVRGSPLAAIVTLSLAIAANTAIFSAVSAVLLRPLPVADPARLVMLWESNPRFGWTHEDAAPANLLDWKEQVAAFDDVAGYEDFGQTATLTGQGEPRLLAAHTVTGNFFTVLGVRPFLGRAFLPEETWKGSGPPAAVLSYRTWRDVFGSDRAVIGRSIRLDGKDLEVAGVLPEGFQLPGVAADVWLTDPVGSGEPGSTFFRRAHWVRPIARLRPGATPEVPTRELQAVVARLQRDYPETNTQMGAGFTPLHEFLVGRTRLPLLVLWGSVGVLLLIGCANVANLLLVRAGGRSREAALRLALGAGRRRLVRQALCEGALLAGLGGLAGLGLRLGRGAGPGVPRPAGPPPGLRHPDQLEGGRCTWPWRPGAARCSSASRRRSGAPAGFPPTSSGTKAVPRPGELRARRWGEALLVGQISLALALSLGAGLLVRSYLRLQGVDPGFDPANVLTVSLQLPGVSIRQCPEGAGILRRAGTEGPRRCRGSKRPRWSRGSRSDPRPGPARSAVAGRPPQSGQVRHREHSPDYQRVMRVPLLRGRLLTEADRRGGPFVVLINQTLAERYFPGEDPVGQQIAFDRVPDSTSTWRTIVGVVGDERQGSLADPPSPEILAPYPQEPRSSMTLVLRTHTAPQGFGPAIRTIVAGLDRDLAISDMQAMDRGAGRLARPGPLPHHPVARLLRDRGHPGPGRHLWRDRPAGPPPAPGNGDPDRAGRPLHPGPVDGASARGRADRNRNRRRHRPRAGHHRRDAHPALRHRPDRSRRPSWRSRC